MKKLLCTKHRESVLCLFDAARFETLTITVGGGTLVSPCIQTVKPSTVANQHDNTVVDTKTHD